MRSIVKIILVPIILVAGFTNERIMANIFTQKTETPEYRILRKLDTSGIPSAWVSQDVRSKEMYDITTDRVSLISIHSSKGLDFELVYLLGIDRLRPAKATKKALISLVYVAMTRAKYRLVIPYLEETELIVRMKQCLPAPAKKA